MSVCELISLCELLLPLRDRSLLTGRDRGCKTVGEQSQVLTLQNELCVLGGGAG